MCAIHVLTVSMVPSVSIFTTLFSQGGVIARALFTLPDFDHQSVNTIFMQATPNQGPGEKI